MNKKKPIGVFFKIISNNFEYQKNKDLEMLGLTTSQAQILLFLTLNKNKIISQRDIEKIFDLSNPTINGLLNRLEAKGFIVRVKNEKDARVREVHLTDKSILVQKEMSKKMQLAEKEMLSVLSREEQETLKMLLEKIVNNIKMKKGGKE